MRDYHFLRTLLYRDRSTTLDVLLQTGREGMSQEGKILDKFPSTREAMYDYDCVVAFDPDWQALNAEQVELLENWVADQGGGLILVAGPIYTAAAINGWTQNPAMGPIRNLYPVEFPRRLTSAESGAYATPDPWPLDFTREGLEADFLMLGDSATAGRRAWTEFAGVYSYCPVRKAKPGATVYARFSDPRAAEGGEQPVYMAGQFYGSGRVFYMGSGEMWRLRAVDEAYFEQFYTKLIRHVTQGRLLRGSSRGVLLDRTGSLFAGQFGGGPGTIDEFPAGTACRGGRRDADFCTGRQDAKSLCCGPIPRDRERIRANFPPL